MKCTFEGGPLQGGEDGRHVEIHVCRFVCVSVFCYLVVVVIL